MKKVIHYGFVTLLVFAAAQGRSRAYAGVDGSFDRTLNVSGVVSIEVSTGSGSINVRSGSGNRVQIHGEIRAGYNWWRSNRDTEEVIRKLEANPPIEQTGQTIRIGRISDSDAQRNVSISYEIVLPSRSNLRAHAGSGSQSIEGVEGKVEVGTGSGSITLRDIKGDLDASAGSGSIQATGIRGGGLHMHTGSGGIRVQGEQTAPWDLDTGSGGIDIDLPANAGFELRAHTGSGGIDVGYPMTVQGRINSDRHDVSGKVGGGGAPLNARTGSGHIRIQ